MSRTVTSCLAFVVGVFAGGYVACGNGGSGDAGDGGTSDTDAPVGTPGGSVPPPVVPSCAAAGGTAKVSAPEPFVVLKDRYEEGWLGAPAVADLDGDGTKEIVLARESKLVAFRPDGSVLWKVDGGTGRMWSSPVVADFRGDAQLEVVVASRKNVTMFDAKGAVLSGFPVTFEDEIRGVAAADVDGDGKLDIVASVGKSGPTDVVAAWRADGSSVAGFPPVAKGASGCDAKCYFAGCYDQNVALADLDGDGKADVVAPHDNAYASFFKGTGAAFDANAM
ncbi:MAG: VCBS repeat-containing protein, partial [Polyangiaceae bacterium]